MINNFSLSGKVAVITGGCGLLGKMHADAIISAGGFPIYGIRHQSPLHS